MFARVANVPLEQLFAAPPVCAVGHCLLVIEVVRKKATPRGPEPGSDHPASRKELEKGRQRRLLQLSAHTSTIQAGLHRVTFHFGAS
jgi:hypothetical protein